MYGVRVCTTCLRTRSFWCRRCRCSTASPAWTSWWPKDRPGKLNVDRAMPFIEENKEALLVLYEDHRRTYRFLKDLKPGQSFAFPDGSSLAADDVLDPPIEAFNWSLWVTPATVKRNHPEHHSSDSQGHERLKRCHWLAAWPGGSILSEWCWFTSRAGTAGMTLRSFRLMWPLKGMA